MDATTPTGSRRMSEVWPARYSLAALPSMTRAAPAKKRRLSTMAVTSSTAAASGLPQLRLSRRAQLVGPGLDGVGQLEQHEAAILRRAVLPAARRPRPLPCATRSTSSGPEAGTLAMAWPLAGFGHLRRLAAGAGDPLAADPLLVRADVPCPVRHATFPPSPSGAAEPASLATRCDIVPPAGDAVLRGPHGGAREPLAVGDPVR